jgi:hypothetical protein
MNIVHPRWGKQASSIFHHTCRSPKTLTSSFYVRDPSVLRQVLDPRWQELSPSPPGSKPQLLWQLVSTLDTYKFNFNVISFEIHPKVHILETFFTLFLGGPRTNVTFFITQVQNVWGFFVTKMNYFQCFWTELWRLIDVWRHLLTFLLNKWVMPVLGLDFRDEIASNLEVKINPRKRSLPAPICQVLQDQNRNFRHLWFSI